VALSKGIENPISKIRIVEEIKKEVLSEIGREAEALRVLDENNNVHVSYWWYKGTTVSKAIELAVKKTVERKFA